MCRCVHHEGVGVDCVCASCMCVALRVFVCARVSYVGDVLPSAGRGQRTSLDSL